MFEQNITLGPGTGTFASHTFEILIMLGVAFLLGLWLGWILWSRFKQQADTMRLEFDSLNATVLALRGETDTLKSKVIDLEAQSADLQSQLTLSKDETDFLREQNAAREERLKTLTAENRRLMIELGLAAAPDRKETLELEMNMINVDNGINQVNVGNANDEDNGEVGTEADHQYYFDPLEPEVPMLAGMHEPEEPLYLQPIEQVVEEVAAPETPVAQQIPESEPANEIIDPPTTDEEPDHLAHAYIIAGPHDDLKVVEGIGPKIEELLFKNGIHTYTELAQTPVSRLKDILIEAGPRYALHEPGTWSAQALLAANAEWDNLKAYQELLNAGKRPK
jgi:predicted flap endonuclease-1-like 5' DNA nuclease